MEIREIPVEYEAVDKEVPALWSELKPKVIEFSPRIVPWNCLCCGN